MESLRFSVPIESNGFLRIIEVVEAESWKVAKLSFGRYLTTKEITLVITDLKRQPEL